MSEFVKSQEEVRANLTMQIREVIDGAESDGRGLDAAELDKINRIEADIARSDEMIAAAKRSAERSVEAQEAGRGFAPVEPRTDNDILRALGNGEIRSHTFHQETRATLVPSVNTVPVSFSDQVFQLARYVGPMLETSEIINRASGESFRIPIVTAYGAPAITAAGSTIADREPTFSSLLLTPFKVAGLVPIANELVTDVGFNLEATLAEAMGNAIGFSVNSLLTIGTGSDQPTGIVTAAGSGLASTATVLRADDLIELGYSLDAAARRLPGVGWHMATSTVGALRRLKDDDGQYIYNPVVGGPDQLLGYPVFENVSMEAVGSAKKSVIFGHLPSYKVVQAGGLQVAVSTDAEFAKDMTVYRYTIRVDGALSHASHVKYLSTS